MMTVGLMAWINLGLFLVLFAMFIHILTHSVITVLHKTYLLFHFCLMLWPLGQFAASITDSAQTQQFHLTLSYVGLSLVGYGWLMFALSLTGHIEGMRRRVMLLLCLPALAVAIGFSWAFEGHFDMLLWTMQLELFVYAFGSLALLIDAYRKVSAVRERQRIGMAITGLLILIAFGLLELTVNILLRQHFPSIPGILTVGSVVSCSYFMLMIEKRGLLDILRIAQQDVFDTISTGLIVLDDEDYVLEKNQSVLPFMRQDEQGRFDLERLLSEALHGEEQESFLAAYRSDPPKRASTELTLLGDHGRAVHLLIDQAPVVVARRRIGRVITVHDVTQMRQLIDETHMQNEQLMDRNRELIRMQDELFAANRQLEQLAVTDSLTGCYNRRYLMEHMEREVMANSRYGIAYSLFLFDIDLFKSVNDVHGHVIGDEVIRSTAEIVRNTLRRTDTLARYGGEEFAVYLPHTGASQADMLAQRIRTAVENNEINMGNGEDSIGVTISIGVLTIEPLHGSGINDPKRYVEALFAKADEALYRAKGEGRNRVVNL
ncbi:diguanylate cyclase (GGDEF)-like protein [Paenibacillus phyllosphaerae]|uniref:Diguanylate cyclase (GGDEF)-like protein n=1 Tax=Paenibacillus phyllosphaerae TaxID=274593 RepID=A0A7W5AUQ2_9BACL|nr:GGDEF domain-containing protein [Paenibacillus phyllosphaerae]MBB3108516.1 diguanylate cyclase (GGDEF)-like protein [Paenibacillus phyllosphaerae]